MSLFHYLNNIIQARLDILRIHSKRMNLTRGINLKKIADSMHGASGAEIKVMHLCSFVLKLRLYALKLACSP